MRAVINPLQQTSEEDIYEMEKVLEDENNLENLVNYASALARSQNQEDVEKSQKIIDDALANQDSEKVIYELVELKILVLYRLGNDADCLKEIEKASAQHHRTLIVSQIKKQYEKARYQKNVKIGLATAGTALLGGIVFFLAFRRNKSK